MGLKILSLQGIVEWLCIIFGRRFNDKGELNFTTSFLYSSFTYYCHGSPHCIFHNQNHQCELVVCSAAESLSYRPCP